MLISNDDFISIVEITAGSLNRHLYGARLRGAGDFGASRFEEGNKSGNWQKRASR